MTLEPIAVLGGGNGAHAMAADLNLAGHEVRLCEHPDFAENFQPTLEGGAIEIAGIGRTGRAEPSLITTDFAAALDGAKLVNVVVPAFGHDRFFEAIIPHLRPEQGVIIWAGDFGSLRLSYLLPQRSEADRPTIFETSTLPYGARLSGPAKVDVLLEANRILISAMPASNTKTRIEELQALWPALQPADHVLQVAFSNPNPIVHPPGCLLNVGRIEYAGDEYAMYREGMTPAVRRVIRAVYQESSVVAEKLGFEIPGYPKKDFKKPASIMGEVFEREDEKYEVIAGILGPTSLESRYITEDLPFGLVPVAELGDLTGVDTPTIDAILHLGSLVCQRKFQSEGRSLESLGLTGLEPSAITTMVTTG